MTFIVSSYFIEVLGDEDIDLEMPKFLRKIWRKLVKPFSEVGAKMKNIVGKINSKLEVLMGDRVKIVLVVK
jgi:hypothetical protein